VRDFGSRGISGRTLNGPEWPILTLTGREKALRYPED
jgi:hypothetical protein